VSHLVRVAESVVELAVGCGAEVHLVPVCGEEHVVDPAQELRLRRGA
jgi:hypothetical protein